MDVLIVGAGPSGLALANVLAANGVDFRLVDRKAGPVEQSRAALVHVRTLELLDRLDLAERAVRRGIRTSRIQLCQHGRLAGEFELAGSGAEGLTPFPFALGLEQHRTEQLLVEGLTERGGRVEWQTEVVDVSYPNKTAVLRRPHGGEESVSARWVVGADGAGSGVRRALGLGFAGKTYAQTGFLADVEMDVAIAPGTVRLNLTRGGFVGMFALRPGRYRLFGAVPPQLAQVRTNLAEIQRWFDEFFHVDARLTRATWTSLFTTHSRMAERFRVGPIFLIGDAAHIHSPAGGQGMNLGIGDAVNLGWKLALVATGQARPGLLDSYEAERLPVAGAVLRNADRGFLLEATRNPVIAWLRTNLAARLIGPATRIRAVRNAVFRLFAQTWITYRNSPAVAGAPGPSGPRPGDRAPFSALYPATANLRHHLLLFEGPVPDPALGDYRRAVAGILSRYAVSCDLHVVPAGERNPHEVYGAAAGTVVLIRPDGHLAYRGSLAALGGLVHHLDTLYTSARVS